MAEVHHEMWRDIQESVGTGPEQLAELFQGVLVNLLLVH